MADAPAQGRTHKQSLRHRFFRYPNQKDAVYRYVTEGMHRTAEAEPVQPVSEQPEARAPCVLNPASTIDRTLLTLPMLNFSKHSCVFPVSAHESALDSRR
jgi:hypothetical protein